VISICDGLDPNRASHGATYLGTATDVADCISKCAGSC